MKGRLIVIEGTDCSGKETQSKLLAKKLNEMGRKAIQLGFPMYDTPTGKIVGGPYLGKPEMTESWFLEGSVHVDPKIACLYYAADRKYNIKRILEYMEEGYDVILDRYISSNMAHQGCKILDSEERFHMFQWIDKLEYWLLDLPKPDMTFLLHLPFPFASKLKSKRQKEEIEDFEGTKEGYLQNAEKTYLELSELYHWNHIDCVETGEIKSIESIHQEIMDVVLCSKE